MPNPSSSPQPDNRNWRPTRSHSAARLLLVVAVSIFGAEAVVMFLLPLLHLRSTVAHALFDSTLLLILVSPALYLLVFRAMVQQLAERERAEAALRAMQEELEARVRERTAELEKLNRELRGAIAERERAQEAQREGEEQFRSVFETTPDAIVLADADGRIVAWNRGAQEVFGYPPQEVLGQPLTLLMPERYRETHLDVMAQASATGEGHRSGTTKDVYGLRRDGTEFPLEVSRATWVTRRGRFFGAVLRDVSRHKRAEAAEREQRQLAEALRDTAAALNSTLEFDEVLDRILANLGRVVPHDASSIALIESGVARLVRGGGPSRNGLDETLRELRLPLAEIAHFREMIESRRPVLISDTTADPRWVRVPAAAWVRSYLGAPIEVRGQVIGFLNLDSATPGYYTAAHGAHLQAFADQAAIALQNARLLEETHRRADQFEALYEMSHDLATQTDLQDLLETIVARARQLLRVPVGGISLSDRRTGDLELVDVQGSNLRLGVRLALTDGATGRAARTRQPFIVEDYQIWPDRLATFAEFGFRAMLHVPMLHRGELIGVLSVTEIGDSSRRFTEPDARLLSLLASQAAGAVHTARLLEETGRRADQFEALYEMSHDLATQTDLQDLLETIVTRARQLLKVPVGAMTVFDRQRGDFEMVVTQGSAVPRGMRIAPGEGAVGRVAQSRRPVILDDYQTWPDRLPRFAQFGLRAMMHVPVLFGGDLIGVLNVAEAGESTRRFADDDGRLLSLFASQAAGAVHTARLLEETRKVAEQLRQSEANYRALFENVPDGVYRTTPSGRLLAANPAVVRILGYESEAELQATDVARDTYVDPAERQRWQQRLEAEGEILNVELSLRRKDGQAITVLDSTRVVRDAAGGVLYYEGVLTDITERKRAEEQLRLQGSALEAAANGILITDRQGVILWVNPAFTRLTGYTAREAIGQTPRLLRSDAHDREFFRGLWETILAGQIWRGEIVNRRKDGSLYTEEMTITPVPDERGEIRHFVAIKQDVTVRRLALAALRESERRFRGVVEQSGDGIVLTDEGGRIVEWNAGEERITGVPRAEVLERPIWDIQHEMMPEERRTPHAREKLRTMIQDFLSLGEAPWANAPRERELVAADGSRRIVQSIVFPIRTEQGFLACAISRDVTEQKQRERELEAVAAVSAALRAAPTRAEMLPVILDQLLELLRAGGAAVALSDPASGQTVIELARGEWAPMTGVGLPPGAGVTGQVIASGQPYVCEDVRTDPRLARPDLIGDLNAMACVPLLAQEQVIGALLVGRRTAFADSQCRTLSAIAEIAGNALQRAALHGQTARRADELAALSAIGKRLTGSLDLAAVLDGLLEVTSSILPGHALAVMLYDTARDELCVEAARGHPVEAWRDFRVKRGEGVTGRVAASLQPALVRDVASTPEWLPMEGMPPSGSEIAVPLAFQNRLVGVINAEGLEPGAFDETHLRLLTAIADYAAVAVENARLFAETQRRLRNLTALRTIGTAITASLDLGVALEVLLDQVTAQLSVHAADILLLDPSSQTLLYRAGRGFRTGALRHTRLRLGEGFAGQAALERRIVTIPDLDEAPRSSLARAPMIRGEGFVTYCAVPLVAKARVHGVLEVFHRSRFSFEKEWQDLLEALALQAALAIDNASLFQDLQRSNAEMFLAYDATIEGWSRAMEMRDRETEGHTQRVTELTLRLASAMGLGEADMVHVRHGALLHDIGKMGIPDAILLKPGPLADEEWAIMRRHPTYAFEMLSPIAYLRPALDIPRCHHEKWDGTGYPQGLKGEQIPLAARIFALADVFDALTSDRPYRPAWSREEVHRYIREQAGGHFDPRVVEAFERLGQP